MLQSEVSGWSDAKLFRCGSNKLWCICTFRLVCLVCRGNSKDEQQQDTVCQLTCRNNNNKKKLYSLSLRQGAHLVVAITGDLDARLPHLHVNNQPFHHRQRVLVVTEVLQREEQTRRKENLKNHQEWETDTLSLTGAMNRFSQNKWQYQWKLKVLNDSQTYLTVISLQSLIFWFIISEQRRGGTHCQQVHDGVTRLSKEWFSEANAEQWTGINCKTKNKVDLLRKVEPLTCLSVALLSASCTSAEQSQVLIL